VSVGASGVVAGGRPLLIVTGLYSEARIAAGAGMTVICSSSDPSQLRAQLDAFDHASVRGIISFGIAGGLEPSLEPGDLVVADEVMAAGGRWATAAALSKSLVEGTNIGRRKIVGGTIVGAEEIIQHPREKIQLHKETGATAVAALRVINDPASRSLPALALNALKPNGDICPRKVLRGVARKPSVIPSLMRTAHDFNRAIGTLRRCRSLLLDSSISLVPANL
jgi:adenosylhomocysteine nucleosidase